MPSSSTVSHFFYSRFSLFAFIRVHSRFLTPVLSLYALTVHTAGALKLPYLRSLPMYRARQAQVIGAL